MIFPPQCKKGGTVLLTALSSPLTGGQSIADIAAGVEGLGFRVQVGETCQASTARGYAAAPPELRARELHNAFASPGIDAIWCVRGGSTAWQLLPLLDSGLIAANPKPFIGFSDVTTLHMALQQRCGLVSYHGPTANRVPDWGTDRFSWPGLLSALEMTGALPIENPPGEPIHVIRPGRAQGELVGGNLSLVVQSLGTPDQLDAAGRILYLEDVGEAVYSLERMLDQLRRAGVLGAAAGLVFGAFTSCRNAYREGFGPEELLRELFRDWPAPVVYNLRSAHCSPMVTLPLGAACTLDGDMITAFR
ncbi:MAG: LD-carboxypeptidase [Oscillospiraceae bacterium]|jgi:muramoyltetrapeptide carboxypeptidase|nr:LD-carboxypeptidase [Oscillospiraceae bacterium]